jgi:hypothetical protein
MEYVSAALVYVLFFFPRAPTALQVQCRIIRLNSGHEIVDHAREIATHFERDGSPIMIGSLITLSLYLLSVPGACLFMIIGGDVYAYTMLGMDWNSSTNELKFLILDPHYTGSSSNLKAIREKGCNWKGIELFKKGVFYNLCLPQRPKQI